MLQAENAGVLGSDHKKKSIGPDKQQADAGSERYRSTNELLIMCLVNSEEQSWADAHQAVWILWT